jgi:hypothetical protein
MPVSNFNDRFSHNLSQSVAVKYKKKLTGDKVICQTLEIVLQQLRKFRLGCIGFKSIVTFQERNISDPIVKIIAELRQCECETVLLEYKTDYNCT